MKKKIKTIFDGTNEQVLNAFQVILNDVKEIITDEEYPSLVIQAVDENAPKAELGKAYVREKGGEKMYNWLKVFLAKKPQNIFNILDTLFCAEKGTYKNKSFKETLQDLNSIDGKDFVSLINFIRAVGLLK